MFVTLPRAVCFFPITCALSHVMSLHALTIVQNLHSQTPTECWRALLWPSHIDGLDLHSTGFSSAISFRLSAFLSCDLSFANCDWNQEIDIDQPNSKTLHSRILIFFFFYHSLITPNNSLKKKKKKKMKREFCICQNWPNGACDKLFKIECDCTPRQIAAKSLTFPFSPRLFTSRLFANLSYESQNGCENLSITIVAHSI
jgi:hypothetical protein